MNKLIFVLPALLVNTFAFASLPADLENIVRKLDTECAGNDNGNIGTFNPNSFNAGKIMKELKADQVGNDSCRSVFSASSDDGVDALNAVLFSSQSIERDCVNSTLSEREQGKLRAMIEDPTNLGVFSKEWDGESGDSEYCMYSNYDIYRADGTVVRIVFNHTD